MRIIAICNQKGGTGKTTTAVNIAAGLTILKRRVLLIDLDPQAHTTKHLAIQPDNHTTIGDVLREAVSVKDTIHDRESLHVIPASGELAAVSVELSRQPGGEGILKTALKNIRGYDYVFIDCAPSLGFLTLNALVAATGVYVPVSADYLSMTGLVELSGTVEQIRNRLNRRVSVQGIICTRYDTRRRICQDVVQHIREHYQGIIFDTIIRENVRVSEAPAYGRTIFEHDGKCNGAIDYMALCREIIKRG